MEAIRKPSLPWSPRGRLRRHRKLQLMETQRGRLVLEGISARQPRRRTTQMLLSGCAISESARRQDRNWQNARLTKEQERRRRSFEWIVLEKCSREPCSGTEARSMDQHIGGPQGRRRPNVEPRRPPTDSSGAKCSRADKDCRSVVWLLPARRAMFWSRAIYTNGAARSDIARTTALSTFVARELALSARMRDPGEPPTGDRWRGLVVKGSGSPARRKC